jgi:sortase A
MTRVKNDSETVRRGVSRRAALIVAAFAVALAGSGAVIALAVDGLAADAAETAASFSPPPATPPSTTAQPSMSTTSTSTSTTSSTTTSTTASTTAVAPTTTTLPLQATAPIAPPNDPRGAEDLGELGRIAIPAIGLDAPMREGIRLTTLDRGPGHWPGSAMPGQVGNVVVAGHRVSHGADFRKIDQLVPGDILTFTTADGSFDYQVTGTQVVDPEAIWIIDPTDTPTATLFACHPPGSTRQRIVVTLALV